MDGYSCRVRQSPLIKNRIVGFDLYVNESKRVACFQYSLFFHEHASEFVAQFIAFLQNQNIQRLIIIGGKIATPTSNYVYLPNERFKNEMQLELSSMNWIEWDQTNEWIHGGGLAMDFFKAINETIPCCIFIKYVSEDSKQSEAADIVQQLRVLIKEL